MRKIRSPAAGATLTADGGGAFLSAAALLNRRAADGRINTRSGLLDGLALVRRRRAVHDVLVMRRRLVRDLMVVRCRLVRGLVMGRGRVVAGRVLGLVGIGTR